MLITPDYKDYGNSERKCYYCKQSVELYAHKTCERKDCLKVRSKVRHQRRIEKKIMQENKQIISKVSCDHCDELLPFCKAGTVSFSVCFACQSIGLQEINPVAFKRNYYGNVI